MLAKALCSKHFWLTAFVSANVLIDTEVLWYLYKNDPPIHRYLHTYLGGTLAGVIAGVLTFGLVELLRRIRGSQGNPPQSAGRRFSLSLIAGLLGGISHIALDSLMHFDMNPFWPFLDGNGLAGSFPLGLLHGILALSGLLGGGIWLLSQAYEHPE